MITAALKTVTTAPGPAAEPFSFRLPKDKCVDPWFQGNRTFWNQRIHGKKPDVQSVLVAQPGAKRGCRFILYTSARRYFERLAQKQATSQRAT